MTIAYFDCFAGISGDMTLGALLDAGADRNLLDATVEALRLGGEVSIEVRHEQRGHAGGTRVVVQTRDRIDRTLAMEVLRMGRLRAIDIHPVERKPSARQG